MARSNEKLQEVNIMEIKKEHLTRQSDIIPLLSLKRKITVIGAGAIGSFTVLALSKMGYEDITVYDFDTVTIENLNAQMYRFSDINKHKVEALRDIISDFSGVQIKIHNEKYSGQKFNDIVICAVDNMSTRKQLYEAHKNNFLTNLLIDPRMAIEYAYIQAFNPNNREQQDLYQKTLFTDEQAEPERCTNKSTIYTSQLIGATISKIVKDFSNKQQYINRLQWDIKYDNVLTVTKTA